MSADAREILVHVDGGPIRYTPSRYNMAHETKEAGKAFANTLIEGVEALVMLPVHAARIGADAAGMPFEGHEGAATEAAEGAKKAYTAVKNQAAKGVDQNIQDAKALGAKTLDAIEREPGKAFGTLAANLVPLPPIGKAAKVLKHADDVPTPHGHPHPVKDMGELVKDKDGVYVPKGGGGAPVPAVKPAPKPAAAIEGKASREPNGKPTPKALPVPKPAAKPACATCSGTLTPLGTGAQSFVRGNEDFVVKRLRRVQFAKTSPSIVTRLERQDLADRMVEVNSRLRERLGTLIPEMESPRPGVLVQRRVDGESFEELSESAAKRAQSEMAALEKKANSALGTSTDEAVLEAATAGYRVLVDDNPANFRFNPDGSVKHWFDPVTVSIDDPALAAASRGKPLKLMSHEEKWAEEVERSRIADARAADAKIFREKAVTDYKELALEERQFRTELREAGHGEASQHIADALEPIRFGKEARLLTGDDMTTAGGQLVEGGAATRIRNATRGLPPDLAARGDALANRLDAVAGNWTGRPTSATPPLRSKQDFQTHDGDGIGAQRHPSSSNARGSTALTAKELDDAHPKAPDGRKLYHDKDHSTTVEGAHENALVNLGETDPAVLKHGRETALVHDLDPNRSPGSPPKVSETLKVLDDDFSGHKTVLGDGRSLTRDTFGWTRRDLDVAKTQILRTQFPFDDAAQAAYENSLKKLRADGMSDTELSRVMRNGALLSEVSDKGSTYYAKSFPEALEASKGLANEIGNGMTVDKLAPHKFIDSIGKPKAYEADEAIAKRLGIPFQAPKLEDALTPAQLDQLRTNQREYQKLLEQPSTPPQGKLWSSDDFMGPLNDGTIGSRKACATCSTSAPAPKVEFKADNPWAKDPPAGSVGAMRTIDPETGKPMEILPAEPEVDWWSTGEPGASGAKHTQVRKDRVSALNKEISFAERRMLDDRLVRINRALANVQPLPAGLKEQFDTARMSTSGTTFGNSNEASKARTNWRAADAWVEQQVADGQHFTPEKLNELHRILGRGLHNNDAPAGVPRGPDNDFWMTAGGSEERLYLGSYDVPKAIEATLEWATRSELPAPEVAGKVYERLVAIHPYGDGNGRAARFAADWILRERGYPPGIWTDAADPFVDLMKRRKTGSELGIAAVERSLAYHSTNTSRGRTSSLMTPRR